MEAGDLTPWVAAFSAELKALRHTDLTINGYIDCARHFSAWLAVNDIGLDEVNDRTLERFAKHRCRCGGYRRAGAIRGRTMQRRSERRQGSNQSDTFME